MNKSDSQHGRSETAQRAAVVTPINSHRRRPLEASKAGKESPVDTEQLARLRETIEQLPEVNATRVVQLHQRIISNEYQVDADRLAEKLLNLEQLLSR